ELVAEHLEELDVLGFLAGEGEQRARLLVVAGEPRPRMVEHEGQDELLDQAEDAEIGMAADLVQRALLGGRGKAGLPAARQALGHDRPREVEPLAVAHDVLDPPADLLRGGEHGIVAVVVIVHGGPPGQTGAPYARQNGLSISACTSALSSPMSFSSRSL